MGIDTLFVVGIYQPFLNILVGIYWLLGLFSQAGSVFVNAPPADMGVAVIIFTIVIRTLMLPLTLAGDRSEKERRELEGSIKSVEETYAAHPIERAEAKKKIMRGNKRMLFSALVGLVIQVIIALMLWRIFAKGLTGEDLHLIYSWMPMVEQPFNLVFLGQYDLTQPSWVLNLIQASLLFVLESLNMIFSPYTTTRKDVIRMQLTLPVIAFIVFSFLPSGKKLFVISALCFSIVYRSARIIRSWILRSLTPEESQDSEKDSTAESAEPASSHSH